MSLRNKSDEWRAFARRIERLVHEMLALAAAGTKLDEACYQRRAAVLHIRLADFFGSSYTDDDCVRLGKRLDKYSEEILTFLLHLGVPADNNHAERQIRGAVLKRKNSYGIRSRNGAGTQAILMSIFRTCNLQKINPIAFLNEAIRAAILTGTPRVQRAKQLRRT